MCVRVSAPAHRCTEQAPELPSALCFSQALMAGMSEVLLGLSETADVCPVAHDGATFSYSRSFFPERELPYPPWGTRPVLLNSLSCPFQDDGKLTPSSAFQTLQHGHQLLLSRPPRHEPQDPPQTLTGPRAGRAHTPCAHTGIRLQLGPVIPNAVR